MLQTSNQFIYFRNYKRDKKSNLVVIYKFKLVGRIVVDLVKAEQDTTNFPPVVFRCIQI
jgi:hypothetical protein